MQICTRLVVIVLCSVALSVSSNVSLIQGISQKGSIFSEREIQTQREAASLTPLQIELSVDSNYIIGPGDFFEISLPYRVFVTQVSPEGSVSITGCGLTHVEGMSLSTAKDAIMKALSERYDVKHTSVQLIQLKRMRVSTIGAVAQSGQLVIEGQTRLSMALRTMGGLLPVADKENIKLYRKKDSISVNFAKLDSGDPSVDLILEQGDVVFVPYLNLDSSITIRTAEGAVSLKYVKGRTIEEYLNLSGVHRQREPGYQSVRVAAEDGSEIWLTLSEARKYSPELKSDIEFMMRKPFVYVGGAVAGMGRVEYKSDWHALDYIASSGVTIITGGWHRVSVVRDGKSFSVDPAHDMIRPGDYIEIPRSLYESTKDLTLFLASLLSVVATAIIISNY